MHESSDEFVDQSLDSSASDTTDSDNTIRNRILENKHSIHILRNEPIFVESVVLDSPSNAG